MSAHLSATNRKEKRIKTQIGLILIAALVVAAFASPALAQDPVSPTESQYNTAPIPAEAGQSGSEEPTGMRSNIGSLPFTGLDLVILGVVTALVALTGLLLRRLSAPRRELR